MGSKTNKVEQVPRAHLVPASSVPLQGIIELARRTYGAHAYQSSLDLYRWCYMENPHREAAMDHVGGAVTDEGQVVGTMDKFYMEWEVYGERVVFPSTGNLVLDASYRKGGLGLRLVLRYTAGEMYVLFNGANANSAPLFRGLKYQELEGAFWGWKLLAPLRAAVRHGMHRAWGISPGSGTGMITEKWGRYSVVAVPDDALIARIAGFLNERAMPVKPHWSPAGLRWRCFHPHGPRHVIIHDDVDAMIISLGVRRGVRLARIVAHHARDERSFAMILDAAVRWTRKAGMDAVATFTFDRNEAKSMSKAGFKQRKDPPSTFLYQDRKAAVVPFDRIHVPGVATDMGLDGIG